MQITKNFNKSEFDSKNGDEMPNEVLENVRKLAKNLQVLRDYLGRGIQITSGFRSVQHNRAVGGVKSSQHLKGTAADIKLKGITPKKVAAAIEILIKEGKMIEGGIGVYKSWVHYDIRGKKARWGKI